MGRRPTRPITWAFVLRTFKRVNMIAGRYDSEAIAKELIEQGVGLDGVDTFLSDVGDYMRTLDHDFYCGNGRPKHDKCAVCDEKIERDHNGARYCSRECRQRAYRVRKAAAEGRNSPIPKRARARTIALAGGVYELRLKKPRRRKNDSGELQSDTSPGAESETNVTPAVADAEAPGP
jgi:hypothetical protein